MKECTKCKETKELTEFYKEANKNDGRMTRCSECIKAISRAYRAENKELVNQRRRKYWHNNKEKCVASSKAYYEANKPKINKQKRQYEKNKYHTDPTFRTEQLCRRRILHALNGRSKSAPTIELLGCTPEHARFHIESQFTEGMTWENTHIDHIQPCSSFDLTSEEEQRKCFHYTNLQPLFAKDNLAKSDKIVPEHQVNLL